MDIAAEYASQTIAMGAALGEWEPSPEDFTEIDGELFWADDVIPSDPPETPEAEETFPPDPGRFPW